MVESIPLEFNGNPEVYMGKIKMVLNTSETSDDMDEVTSKSIDKESILFSDNSTSYVNLVNLF